MTTRGLPVLGALLIAGSTVCAHASAITIGTIYNESSARLGTAVPGANGCANTAHCFVSFNLVPAGKHLLITDVTCKFVAQKAAGAPMISGASIGSASKDNQSGDRFQQVSTTLKYNSSPTTGYYIASDKTRLLVKTGERPVIILQGASADLGYDGACFIAGKVGNPPE
jgi:hypothetical protein